MAFDSIEDAIASCKGAAVILAGSPSDRDHARTISEKLREYSIPHTAHVASAHKQPERLLEVVKHYDAIQPGSYVIVAVAGGTDALSGTTGWHAMAPTISCPPEYTKDRTINHSCLSNPPGSSNAFIFRPANAARFIAQLYANINPEIRERLQQSIADKTNSLKTGSDTLQSTTTYLGE